MNTDQPQPPTMLPVAQGPVQLAAQYQAELNRQQQLFQQEVQRNRQELQAALNQVQAERQAAAALNPPSAAVIEPLPPQILSACKPNKPQEFHGKLHPAADTWLMEVERHFSLVGLQPKFHVRFVASFLRDQAIEWWNGVEQTVNPVPTECSVFEVMLLRQFQPIEASETARTQLDTLRQRNHVSDYNQRFQRIIQMVRDMGEQDKVHAYIRGLKINIAHDVKLQRPKTLYEAMSCAMVAETYARDYRNSNYNRPYNRQNNYNHASDTSSPMEVGAVDNEGENNNNNYPEDQEANINAIQSNRNRPRLPRIYLSDADYQKCREQRLCFHCMRPSHTARFCDKIRNLPKHERGQ